MVLNSCSLKLAVHGIRSDKSVNLKEYHDTSVSPLKQWKLPRLQWGKDDQVHYPEQPVVFVNVIRCNKCGTSWAVGYEVLSGVELALVLAERTAVKKQNLKYSRYLCWLQEEALGREVQHLRGEIVGAEERENLHLAQYVDNWVVVIRKRIVNRWIVRCDCVEDVITLLCYFRFMKDEGYEIFSVLWCELQMTVSSRG